MSRPDRSISQRLDRAGSIEAKREALKEWVCAQEFPERTQSALLRIIDRIEVMR